MSECQRCAGKAQNFLCAHCERALGQSLADLPWWLDRLTETATGQTRMADNGGRRAARKVDLDGEKPLAECIETLPPGDDLDKARKQREKHALAVALATGGCNARASDLLAEISDSLGYWMRVLCEERGRDVPRLGAGVTYGRLRAKWLRKHLGAIVTSTSAGDIAMDIDTHIEDIVVVVNRPTHVLFLGLCPTWDDDRNATCGRRLRAPADAVEVYCHRCRTTHNVTRLLMAQLSDAERELQTFDELARINSCLPDGYGVPARTLRFWRQTEVLKPRGWLRPDGHRGIGRHAENDVALFSWSDVKKLRDSRKQRTATGATAHVTRRSTGE
jgi:hypothetical protein